MIAKFSLPSFYSKFNLISTFLRYYYSCPEQFREDRIIDSFYDTVPGLIWGGGRYTDALMNTNINTVLATFNQYPKIKLRHIFTNNLLSEYTLHDYRCNKFVYDYIREQDEVVLNHPLLIEHFKKNFARIPIIYSTTLGITDIDKVNEITATNIYVLNYNYNNDNEYLTKLEHKNNVEILCAEPCIPNCPKRTEHYQMVSKAYLSISTPEEEKYVCPFGAESRFFYEIQELPHAIINERVDELTSQGFQYFKISGRTLYPPSWLEIVLYYLAKPEYVNIIRERILDAWW